ncbi:MAG: c-type cytochrome [Bryobacteraceae bacterium]
MNFKLVRWILPAAIATCLVAADKVKMKEVPIKDTPVTSGSKMFQEYCAACHGATAKGDGPAAAALKASPGDLTRLTARNDGKFPRLKVRAMLDGKEGVTAHGTREMPIWGSLFRTIGRGDPGVVELRMKNLIDYVESLQGK